jgi:hypothetical protein
MLRRGLARRLAGVGPRVRGPAAAGAGSTSSAGGGPAKPGGAATTSYSAGYRSSYDFRPFPPKPEVNSEPRIDDMKGRVGGIWNTKVGKLIKKYGFPLAIYYLAFNETCVLIITALLHYDYLGAGDIAAMLKWLGAERLLNVGNVAGKTREIGPITISARFIINFTIASTFMSLWTGFQIPFCIATLPHVTRVVRAAAFWRKKPAVMASPTSGATSAAGAAAAASPPPPPSPPPPAGEAGPAPSV